MFLPESAHDRHRRRLRVSAPTGEPADWPTGGRARRPLRWVVLSAVAALVLAAGVWWISAHSTGWSDITIDSVTLAMMGEDNLQGLEPRTVNPNGQTVTSSEPYGDITFTMSGPLVVGPGDDQLLEAVIDYHGGAEYAQCSSIGLHTPDVAVSVKGVTATKSPPPWTVIWFQQGSLSGCDSAG